MQSLFAFAMPGPFELLIIAGVVLLLFGSARLPSLMRNLGRSATEFKKGMQNLEDDGNSEPEEKDPYN